MARSRPIVVEFTANVRDFLRKTKDVERSTEDIADELEKAEDAAGDFEDSFTRAMKDAERQAERSGRDIGDSFDGVDDALGEVGADAGKEFQQNLGESIASGDAENIAQDVLGGVVSGLGGKAGVAAGILAGGAVLAFQKIQEEIQARTDAIEGIAQNALDNVRATAAEMDAAVIESQFQDWAEENLEYLNGMTEPVETLGLKMSDVAREVYASDESAAAFLDHLRDIARENSEWVEDARGGRREYDDIGRAAIDLTTEVSALKRGQEDVNEEAGDLADIIGTDGVGAITRAEIATNQWLKQFDRPRVLDVEVRTRVTGDGASYVDRTNSNPSPGHSATRNLYRGTREPI